MSDLPAPRTPPPARLPGWTVTAGLGVALCAGVLDLGLSLWLQPPAGLGSGTTVLLVLAVTTATALAAFLGAFAVLRILLRVPPLPLALFLSTLGWTGLLVASLIRSLHPGPTREIWRQALLLGAPAVACAALASALTWVVPGLTRRRHLWARASLAAPLLGGETLLALWFVRYRLPAEASPVAPVLALALAGALTLVGVSRVRSLVTARRGLASLAILALAGPWIAAWRAPRVATKTRQAGERPRRVILLSIDTLRAGALSCYGSAGARTPHLDRLAHDALRFTHAYSPAAWTLPAMASVMTGLSPEAHRAVHGRSRVPGAVLTLAEALQRAGFRTAALVSSTVLGPAANLTQGFDEYTAFPGPWIGHSFGAGVLAASAESFRPAEAAPLEMADLAAGWLRAHREGDSFLWVHIFDPHAPYGPPQEYLDGATPPPGATWRFEGWDEEAIRAGTFVPSAAERDWIRRLYLGEVRAVDDAVGRFTAELRRLGMYDDALIVVVSDHGEEFWEHGAYGHGHTLYDELLHVPLLIKLPRGGPHGRVDSTVSTGAVMATVLELTGHPLPASYPAASRLPLTDGRPGGPLLSFGLNRYEDRRAVRFGTWKYICWDLTGREELYDLAADPGEQHDLATHEPSRVAEGRALLAGLLAQSRETRRRLRLGEGEQAVLDDGTVERLRALGYLR